MKKLIYTASFALAFFAATPVNLVMANPSSTDVCQQAIRPATTGGAIREQLEAAAKCKSQSSANFQTTTQQSIPVTRAKITNNQEQSSSSNNRSTTEDICSLLRATGTTGGSVREALEAMAKCRSGR